ncbi:hypothetical protein [Amycolatopsis antarctica]|uniref:hypothetical protein n=1 Tax=Amycolatopsis antarctica TaxID=1854586 RepID=UPI0013FD5391|nr:hypothetical protein [Amycolatopsis antarctica]
MGTQDAWLGTADKVRQVYGGTALGAGVAAAAGTGGGYEFEPEEIDGVIGQ